MNIVAKSILDIWLAPQSTKRAVVPTAPPFDELLLLEQANFPIRSSTVNPDFEKRDRPIRAVV